MLLSDGEIPPYAQSHLKISGLISEAYAFALSWGSPRPEENRFGLAKISPAQEALETARVLDKTLKASRPFRDLLIAGVMAGGSTELKWGTGVVGAFVIRHDSGFFSNRDLRAFNLSLKAAEIQNYRAEMLENTGRFMPEPLSEDLQAYCLALATVTLRRVLRTYGGATHGDLYKHQARDTPVKDILQAFLDHHDFKKRFPFHGRTGEGALEKSFSTAFGEVRAKMEELQKPAPVKKPAPAAGGKITHVNNFRKATGLPVMTEWEAIGVELRAMRDDTTPYHVYMNKLLERRTKPQPLPPPRKLYLPK